MWYIKPKKTRTRTTTSQSKYKTVKGLTRSDYNKLKKLKKILAAKL